MKKYKLLVDSPLLGVSAGAIFIKSSDKSDFYGFTRKDGYSDFTTVDFVENTPNIFEEIKLTNSFTEEDMINFAEWLIGDKLYKEQLEYWVNKHKHD
jgi:hypothetical protein